MCLKCVKYLKCVKADKADSGGVMKYVCSVCGVEFSAAPSRKRRYCSHACNARANFGKLERLGAKPCTIDNVRAYAKVEESQDEMERLARKRLVRKGVTSAKDEYGNAYWWDAEGVIQDD